MKPSLTVIIPSIIGSRRQTSLPKTQSSNNGYGCIIGLPDGCSSNHRFESAHSQKQIFVTQSRGDIGYCRNKYNMGQYNLVVHARFYRSYCKVVLAYSISLWCAGFTSAVRRALQTVIKTLQNIISCATWKTALSKMLNVFQGKHTGSGEIFLSI